MDSITTFIVLVLVVLVLLVKYKSTNKTTFKKKRRSSFFDIFREETERERVGREAEDEAFKYILKVKREDDIVLRNVKFTYNNQECEIDFVVVNRFGVFIIESKFFRGVIKGNINDKYWHKEKISSSGYSYDNEFKNPIIQLNWHIDSLARYLRENGIKVWIMGYPMILNNERSQIKGKQILHNIPEIDKAIHTRAPENLRHFSKPKREKTINLLK